MHYHWPQFSWVKEDKNTACSQWSLALWFDQVFTSQHVRSVCCNLKTVCKILKNFTDAVTEIILTICMIWFHAPIAIRKFNLCVYQIMIKWGFLPSASEGWGKIIISVCLFVDTRGVHQDGVPRPDLGWGPPKARSGEQGTPGQRTPCSGMDYPQPGQDGGYPRMGYPQSWDGVPPSHSKTGATPGWGTPHPGMRSPPPPIGQEKEYLLCGGRYVSRVHAGGRSC